MRSRTALRTVASPLALGLALIFATLTPGLRAHAGRLTRVECREGEGNRHWCRADDPPGEGNIGVCHSAVARADVWVDQTGYYRLRSLLLTNDSGDHQRNEAFAVLVTNSRKPRGFPLDGNCQDRSGYKVIPDGVQREVGDLGVFYLMADEVNHLEVVHYCVLYRQGNCQEFFHEGGEDGGACSNCESVGFAFQGLSQESVPTTPCDFGRDYEFCDGIDNDCDGQVDGDTDGDGSGACDDCEPEDATRHPGATEICDGVDNDCDGEIDEGARNPCGGCSPLTGEPGGACGACGELVCQGLEALVCQEGSVNTCGGCGSLPGTPGEACGPCGIWICRDGALSCEGPEPNLCGGCGPLPSEVCDGVDNDCDGVVDEIQGNEVCNCRDDDCNGATDEGDLCGLGLVCHDCGCFAPCAAGECSEPGTQCWDGFCRTLPCPQAPCPAGWICRAGVECVDACLETVCPPGTTCAAGECRDESCHAVGCPPGLLCIDRNCVPDPCAGVPCPVGDYCRDGVCVASCASLVCSSGMICRDGVCQEDSCLDAGCRAGRVCRAGACVPDPCAGVECPPSLECRDGRCDPDPCEWVRCPSGEICVEGGECVGPADPRVQDPDPADEQDLGTDLASDAGLRPLSAEATGGCGCSSGGAAARGGVLLAPALLFAVLALGARRRA